MADSRISTLPAASALTGTELAPVVQGGVTVQSTTAAIAALAAGSLSTTGSPASGNLTKFSGAASITNGDLSGDVTTSGTLAATLASSGVAAATYGDAAHVPQIAIDAKGRITSASSVAITASGIPYVQKITTIASQTQMDFTSIPGTFSDLLLTLQIADTSGTGLTGVWVKVNNDGTAANYMAEQWLDGFASTAAAGTDAASTSGVFCSLIPSAGGLGSVFALASIWVPNYAGTVFPKGLMFSSGAYINGPSLRVREGLAVWKTTATAITRLTLTAPTAFVTGSVGTLYGLG